MNQKPWHTFSEYLAQKGLRATRQRRVIVDAFSASRGHITADEIYERVHRIDSGIGQATVRRMLNLLVNAGMAIAHDFPGGKKRYEVTLGHKHHDHMICLRCGRILEFSNSRIEALQEKAAREVRFRITGHRHEMFGFCFRCRKNNR